MCPDRLLFDHRQMYERAMVKYRRKTLPPFAGQITHDRELERLREGLFALRRMVKAESATDEPYLWAIAQAPGDTYVNVRYGQLLVEQGRIGEAVRRYQRLLESQPYNMTIRLALAGACALGGMRDLAIEALTSDETPYRYDRKQALLMLGTQYAQKGLIAQAATVYEELSRIDPDNVDVLVNLAAAANFLRDAELVALALDAASTFASTPERRFSLTVQEAGIAVGKKDFQAAEAVFRRAVATATEAGEESDKRLAEFYLAVTRLLQAVGRPDSPELAEVRRTAERAIMLGPGHRFMPDLQPTSWMRFNVAFCNDERLFAFLEQHRP